jgi:hypothetical protein
MVEARRAGILRQTADRVDLSHKMRTFEERSRTVVIQCSQDGNSEFLVELRVENKY